MLIKVRQFKKTKNYALGTRSAYRKGNTKTGPKGHKPKHRLLSIKNDSKG
jgi:hypothetical protein